MNGRAHTRAFRALLKHLQVYDYAARLINLGWMNTLAELHEEKEPRGVTKGECELFNKFQLIFLRIAPRNTHTRASARACVPVLHFNHIQREGE